MIWDGKSVLILWNNVPSTTPAIKWHQKSSGNWRGSDRTSAEDTFESDVVFRGPISELTALETVLNDNRAQFTATFNSGEQIFGADVLHTGNLTVIVTQYSKIRKASFKAFEMTLRLRLTDPSFTADTPDFTKLRKSSHQDTRETRFEMTKHFTYDQEVFIADRLSNDGTEAGLFTANFTQTIKEMAAIRRYLLVTARATKIAFPTFDNMSFPFGTRAGSGPFNCRVISWRDLGRDSFGEWGLSITFARDLSYWNELPSNIIQETGSAPDQIQESGSQVDIIQEIGT